MANSNFNQKQPFKNFDIGKIDNFMKDLVNNYCLYVNNIDYFFEEIELYFYSEIHKDCSVLKRIKQASEIFFHTYGFDICFESNETIYGGILIRSLRNNNSFINGPKNCLLEILNTHNGNGLNIKLKQLDNCRESLILKSKRIKGTCIKESKDDEQYRYITDQCKIHIQNKGTNYYRKKSNNLAYEKVD